ncbi:unnamed protein product [Caenorhabditis angaria]|uniref:Aminopeptidase n=1 Tax=Caenorhabditis angaria TaxID=860376 RepID=A0A9P1NBF5_9PELO|nr:unnamed protein product [Caenorhabditis angaria]
MRLKLLVGIGLVFILNSYNSVCAEEFDDITFNHPKILPEHPDDFRAAKRASREKQDYITKQRLPANLYALSYDLWFKTYFPVPGVQYDSAKNFTFDGRARIGVEAVVNSDRFILNAYNFTISGYKVVDFNGIEIPINSISQDNALQQLSLISNANSITAGDIYTIYINYTGIINPYQIGGVYYTSYTDTQGAIHYMLATHMEPFSARLVFPGLDEPSYKARFTISLEYPTSQVALSNMKETTPIDYGNGWSFIQFPESPLMSSYLVAFAVGPYVYSSYVNQHNTTVRAWGWPGTEQYLEFAAVNSGQCLYQLGEYTGIKFPLEKSDQIGMPEFLAGAMENWGLIIYKYQYIAVNEQTMTLRDKEAAAKVMCHELAHQWFGDLVTTAWWDDLFLNEGFADYFMTFTQQLVYPIQATYFDTLQVLNELQVGMNADVSQDAHPLVYPEGPAFDSITYQKGASMLRMLSDVLGPAVFREGLQKYLKSKEYSNAKDIDLFTILTQVAQDYEILDWNGNYLNVTDFMQPYVHQTNHPLIRIYNNEINQPATFTQEPFATKYPFDQPSPYNWKWNIPIRTTSYKQSNVSNSAIQWISAGDGSENAVKNENKIKKHAIQWEIGSVTSATYGRLIYDDIGFDKLIKSIQQNDVADNVKLQLLADEYYYLQRQKSLNQAHSFDRFLTLANTILTTQSFNTLPSYSVFAQAQIGLENIAKLFRDSMDAPLINRMYQLLFSEVYKNIQWVDSVFWDTTTFSEAFLPFAVRYNIGNVQNQTLQMFQNVKDACGDSTNGTAWCNPYSTNFRKAIYCGAAKYAPTTSDYFFRMLQYYNAEVITNPYFYQEYMALLEGMACTESPNLLKVLIRQFVASPLNQYTLFGFFKYNSVASDALYNYLYNNIQLLNSTQFNVDAYLDAMTYSWASYKRTDQFAQLTYLAEISNVNMNGDRINLFNNYQDRISTNLGYAKTYGLSAIRWLYDNTVVVGKTPWEKSLDGSIVPSNYYIYLQPFIPGAGTYIDYQNMTFFGSAEIKIDVVKETNTVIINAHRLVFEIDNINILTLPEFTLIPIDKSNIRKDYDKGVLYIPINGTLLIGSYNLYFTYTGFIFQTPSEGNTVNSYYTNNGRKGWIYSTDFEGGPSVRSLLPSFDEPSYKATFNVTVKYPSDMIALSNGLEQTKELSSDGWTTLTFDQSPLMSSYLLAICVGHFSSLSKVVGAGTLVRQWTWSGMEQYGEFGLNVTAGTLEFMNTYFRFSYILPKLDVVALPEYTQNAGAMENWGLIIGEYNLYMFDPDYATTRDITEVAETAAHEVIHQWFGDLVTMDWWDDIFLNEGFAQYWFANGINYTYPDQEDYAIEYNRFMINRIALEIDCIDGYSKPVISDKPPVFGATPYYKGSALLNLLSNAITPDLFKYGLEQYLFKYYYKNTSPQNLWESLTNELLDNNVRDWNGNNLNVSSFMVPFTTLVSYPILTLEIHGTSTVVTTQTSCLANGNQWNLPLFSQDQTSTTFNWFTNTTGGNDTIWMRSLASNFRIDNAGSSSFTRVQYDDKSWLQIRQQLLTDISVVSSTTRAMLLDDAWFFYRSGRWQVSKFLDLTLYLPKETALAPWEVAFDFFDELLSEFRYQAEFGDIQNYIYQSTKNAFNIYGFSTNDKWTRNQLANYITQLHCASGNRQCRLVAKSLFDNFLSKCATSQYGTGKCSGIHPDLRKSTYCYGILQSNITGYQTVDTLYQLSTANSRYFKNDRDNLLNAIGCIQDLTYLDEKINGVIQGIYPTSLLQSIAQNDQTGGFILYNYFAVNTLAVVQAPFDFALYLKYMTLDWNTDFQSNVLQNFPITSNYQFLTELQKKQLFETTENVIRNVQAIDNVKGPLIAWIQANFGAVNAEQ